MSVGIFGGLAPAPAAAGGAGGATFAIDIFTPVSVGQTGFTLSSAYLAGGLILALVNSASYDTATPFFTAAGTTFTWLDTTFTLDPDDCLVVIYQTS